MILLVALLPECFKILGSNCFNLELTTAFFKQNPLDLMIGGKQNFEKHNASSINANPNENYSFFCLSWHKKINVQENEGQYSIIEKPVSNE